MLLLTTVENSPDTWQYWISLSTRPALTSLITSLP